jgi:hypothetical protein
MVGLREEGDGADKRAPHGGDVREREGVSAGVRKVEKNTLSENTPTRLRSSGPSGELAACGAERASVGQGWAGWAEIQRKFLFE